VVEVLSKLREKIEQPVKMIDMFRFPTIRQFSQSLTGEKQDSQKLLDSEERAKARKDARKNTANRRRARQK
jgi:FtsZ-binding cell division protein ZapB